MKIGKPVRAYVVEPLEAPATPEQSEHDDEDEEEAVSAGTERETAPTA
jgi:hypothetical protein